MNYYAKSLRFRLKRKLLRLLPVVTLFIFSHLWSEPQTENPFLDGSENEISSRDGVKHEDHYNLYDRNHDRENWDVRENWRHNPDAYYRGEMQFEASPRHEEQDTGEPFPYESEFEESSRA